MQRAVHSRDIQQIESNFDQPSVSASRLSECSGSDCIQRGCSQEEEEEADAEVGEEEEEEEYLRGVGGIGIGIHESTAVSDMGDRWYRRSEDWEFQNARKKCVSALLDRRAPFAPAPFVTKHGEESHFMQQASGYGVLPERLEEDEEEVVERSPGCKVSLQLGGRHCPEAEMDREEMELGLGEWASDNESEAAKMNNGSLERWAMLQQQVRLA